MQKRFIFLMPFILLMVSFSGGGHEQHELPEGALALVDVNEHEMEAMQIRLVHPYTARHSSGLALRGEIRENPASTSQILAPIRGLFLMEEGLFIGQKLERNQRLGTLIPLPEEEFMDLDRLAFSADVLHRKEQSELSRVENLVSSQSASEKALIDARANARIAENEQKVWEKHRWIFENFADLGHETADSVPVLASESGVLLKLPASARLGVSGGEELFRIRRAKGFVEIWFEATPSLREIWNPGAKIRVFSSRGEFDGENSWLMSNGEEVHVMTRIGAGSGLIPGMRVRGEYRNPQSEEKLCLPASTLIREGEDALVFTQEEDGHYAMRRIQIGAESRECMQVLGGLDLETSVVSDGVWQLYMKARMPKDGGGHHGHSH